MVVVWARRSPSGRPHPRCAGWVRAFSRVAPPALHPRGLLPREKRSVGAIDTPPRDARSGPARSGEMRPPPAGRVWPPPPHSAEASRFPLAWSGVSSRGRAFAAWTPSCVPVPRLSPETAGPRPGGGVGGKPAQPAEAAFRRSVRAPSGQSGGWRRRPRPSGLVRGRGTARVRPPLWPARSHAQASPRAALDAPPERHGRSPLG